MNDINDVRVRLHTECKTYEAYSDYEGLLTDLRAILADHARLQAMAEELKRFRSLARWVSNSAGHGVNSNQRSLGEELLVLIDAANGVQP